MLAVRTVVKRTSSERHEPQPLDAERNVLGRAAPHNLEAARIAWSAAIGDVETTISIGRVAEAVRAAAPKAKVQALGSAE